MKKLLSGLLTIVMFFSIIGTLTLIGLRGAISTGSVEKMIDTMIEKYDFLETTGIAEEEELKELMEEDKEFKKMFSKVVADTLKYSARISDEMPDFKNLLEYIEEKTDIEIEKDAIEENIKELEDSLKEERISEDTEGLDILQSLFSTSSLISGIIVTILLELGICVLTKDVKKGVKRLGETLATAGLAVYGLSKLLISFISQESIDEEVASIIETMLNPFDTVGIISIILGVVLIILASKIAQTFASINHSNQSIQKLDDSIIQ
ncbi:MAG: hypothetical protein ACI4XM_00755 [Candidatus Coprovivens sp.]